MTTDARSDDDIPDSDFRNRTGSNLISSHPRKVRTHRIAMNECVAGKPEEIQKNRFRKNAKTKWDKAIAVRADWLLFSPHGKAALIPIERTLTLY